MKNRQTIDFISRNCFLGITDCYPLLILTGEKGSSKEYDHEKIRTVDRPERKVTYVGCQREVMH